MRPRVWHVLSQKDIETRSTKYCRLARLIDRYITSLASALTANVTREAKWGTSIESPGNTDTTMQADTASLETAVKTHIQRKRILLDKALHTKHA